MKNVRTTDPEMVLLEPIDTIAQSRISGGGIRIEYWDETAHLWYYDGPDGKPIYIGPKGPIK